MMLWGKLFTHEEDGLKVKELTAHGRHRTGQGISTARGRERPYLGSQWTDRDPENNHLHYSKKKYFQNNTT